MAIEASSSQEIAPRSTGLQLDKVWKPFRYHFIHDLESLWWIAMWPLFTTTTTTTTKPAAAAASDHDHDEQYTMTLSPTGFDDIFTTTTNLNDDRVSSSRFRFFTQDKAFSEIAAALPGVFRGSIPDLYELRQSLVGAYQALGGYLDCDTQPKVPHRIFLKVYDEAGRRFMDAAEHATTEMLALTAR